MTRSLLLGLVLVLSSSCKIVFDGGRPNIIPLPQDDSHLGDRPNTADNAMDNADFTSPWNTISLPYGNSEIVAADASHIELAYKNNKLEGTATSFDSYMRVGGWSRTGHAKDDHSRAYRYSREGEQAGFVVTYTAPDDLKVTVELGDKLAAGDSKVSAAFGGHSTGAAGH